MGGNKSVQDVLNDTLNSISMQVLVKNSTGVSASSIGSNDLIITGSTNVTVSGFNQINSSQINVQALTDSINSGALQADLLNKLSAAVQQIVPTLAVADDTQQKITNNIKNIINTNINMQNFTNIALQAKQENIASVTDSKNVSITNSTQNNEATLIASVVTTTNNQIVAAVKASSTEAADALQQPAPLLDLNLGGGTVIIIVIVAILLGGCYWLYTSGEGVVGFMADHYIGLGIGTIVVGILIYFAIDLLSDKK
jgi:hypothetical protein